MRGRLLVIAAILAAAACGTESKSGTLSVSLSGAQPARAALFQVIGPHAEIAVPPGQPFRIFPSGTSGDTVTIAVIASQGHTLSGALVTVRINDTGTTPTVSLLQVAGDDYSLLSTSSYSLSIAP